MTEEPGATPPIAKRTVPSRSRGSSISDHGESDGGAVPLLRRSGSMTNLHYQRHISAAALLLVYEKRPPGALIDSARHVSRELGDEHAGGAEGEALSDAAEGAHERSRAFTCSGTSSDREEMHRKRSSTVHSSQSPWMTERSSAVVKSHKGALKGSVDSLPDFLARRSSFDRKEETKALENEHQFRRMAVYSQKELNDPDRARRSPRTQSGARTRDTLVSVDDAEALVLQEAQPSFISRLRQLPSDRPLDIRIEFHGSEGSCGASEEDALAEGCKGRVWTFSQTLAQEFLASQVAPGSTLTAASFYLNPTKEATRNMPKKWHKEFGDKPVNTYYGYKTGVTRVLYGREAEPSAPRTEGKSYELNKRVVGEWGKQ